jgi:hypothetical protein
MRPSIGSQCLLVLVLAFGASAGEPTIHERPAETAEELAETVRFYSSREFAGKVRTVGRYAS